MSLAEVGAEIRKISKQNETARTADAAALQIDDTRSPGSDAVTASTHAEVDAVAPGVFAKDDYQSGIPVPSTTASSSSFDQIFNDLKTAFMSHVVTDMNLALAAGVREIIAVLDELQALSTVMASEAAKISVAASAGLLVPPSRVDIESLKDDGQRLRDDISRSSAELRSGRARRQAARDRQGLLENNRQDMVEAPVGIGERDGRVLEALATDPSRADEAPGGLAVEVFAPQPSGAPGLVAEANRQSVADRLLGESTSALRGSVLNKVAYLAICQALAALDTGNETRDTARTAYTRLQELVALVIGSLSPSYDIDLPASVHELVADGVDALGSALQKRLDALDQFLNVPAISLPTFVSTVENIGDEASNVSFVESLMAACGLRMDSFCEAQGMLEVAASLDQLLVLDPIRVPAFGRACFTLSAPDPVVDYQPPITRPDREARLLLTEAIQVGGLQVKARFPRADVRRALTTAVPSVLGTLAALVGADAETVTVSGLGSAPATVGNLRLEPGTPQEEPLRYESRETSGPSYVFTLIDKPALSHGLASTVSVDGEHRDDFSSVYGQRQEIGGGPGSLRLAGDNEIAETLAYDGSVFNPTTGVYTFTLSSPAAYLHRPQTSGKPSPTAKKILFRNPSSTSPAPRFSVSGANITPDIVGQPANMASEISVGDFLVLSDDVNETPMQVQSVSATQAVLVGSYHNGDVAGVSLSRLDAKSPAGSTVKARFSQRTLDELGIDGSLATVQDVEDFQILLDQDDGTRNLRRDDGVVAFNGTPIRRDTLSTVAAIFEPGDDGKIIFVQNKSDKRLISGTMTYVSAQQVHFDSTLALTGTAFSQSGGTLTAAGGKFKSELRVDDYVAFGAVRRKVTAVLTDATATVTPAVAVASTSGAWIVVGDTVASASRNLSFIRSPRETKIVSGVQRLSAPDPGKPATDGLWQMNLTVAAGFAHGTQRVDANPTINVIPQSLSAFVSQPTSVTPRFEPDVVPPGTLTLRGTFQDPNQAPILGPLLAGGGDVEIGGLSLPYSSLVVGGEEVTVTLAYPGTTRAFEAGEEFCIPTSSTVEALLNDFFGSPTWPMSFESWFSDLDEQLRQLHSRLCRLLQGRPEDLVAVAAAIAAGAAAFSLSLLTLRVTMEALLAGLGDMSEIDAVIDQARDAGMDQAADAMARGDVLAVAQMNPVEATTSGSLLARVVVYREKLTTYDQSVAADNLAAELRGNQTSVQILAETRAGFKIAAAGDITRKTAAAAALSARLEIVTR